jgi:MarR family transcriptional regulator, organic hydroperoxide resistance regulator
MPRPPGASRTPYALEPSLEFLRLLWSIEHSLERMSKRMARDMGITMPQRLVLRVVGQFPDLSAGDLAHILRLHPSTITGILQRLVARGFLERKRDPEDSRRARLRLKPSAMRHTRVAPGTVERAVAAALARTGTVNVRAAQKVLTEIARSLDCT